MIVFAVAVLQQLTGVNSILQFSAVILKTSGASSNMTAMLGSTVVTAVNFGVTIIALCLIDKVGRKPLLTIGTAGCAIFLIYLGSAFYFTSAGALKGELLLGGIIGFIISYAIGPGVVVWLVLSELLPTKIRSMGMSIALFLNSMASTILASVYLPLEKLIGYAGIFFVCGFFALLYYLIAYFFIPETNAKTLEEIEQGFIKDTKTAEVI